MKTGQVFENIAYYMSTLGNKEYSKFEASAIGQSIRTEFEERQKDETLKFKSVRSKIGKEKLNNRVAAIVKRDFSINVTAQDVLIFKKARPEEYQNRTGRCAWGFKDLRKRLGYDPETGLELSI